MPLFTSGMVKAIVFQVDIQPELKHSWVECLYENVPTESIQLIYRGHLIF